MHNPKDQLNQLLIPLCFLLRLSGDAYSKYLSDKIYLHAESIRQANKKICSLITNRAAFIPDDLRDDIVILLNHYQGWFIQFREHKRKVKPALNDPFVFYPVESQIPYPRQVEERIFQYTEDLKQTIDK